MIADINAAKMIINAGFAKETCLNEITFIAEKMHWKQIQTLKVLIGDIWNVLNL